MTSKERILGLINTSNQNSRLKAIAQNVLEEKRISVEDGIYLFKEADLGYLGILANYIREKKHGLKAFFNRNIHIEPTNICIYSCKFCSYARKIGDTEGKWEYTEEEIINKVREYEGIPITEVHLVGGVHPHRIPSVPRRGS